MLYLQKTCIKDINKRKTIQLSDIEGMIAMYTVKSLLEFGKTGEFPQLKLLCGKRGLELEIKGIRIIDMQGIERCLTGGELLLTSFWVYISCSDQEAEHQLKRLAERDVSGFIVRRIEEYDPFGRRLALLKKYCEQYGIPLLEMSDQIDYGEIIRYVLNKLYDADIAQLKYFKIIHDSFHLILLKSKGIFAKPEDILLILKKMIGNPIGFYYSSCECIYSTNGDYSKLILSEDLELLEMNIVTNFPILKQTQNGVIQYVVKLDVISELDAYMTITEEIRPVSSFDWIAIENALHAMRSVFVYAFLQNELEKKYQRNVLQNILEGALKQDERAEAAAKLGLKEKEFYRVVNFNIMNKNSGGGVATQMSCLMRSNG